MPVCPNCWARYDGVLTCCPQCGTPRDPVTEPATHVAPAERNVSRSFGGENDDLPDIRFPGAGGESPAPLRWYQARLWLISLLCFAAGFVTQITLAQVDVAYSYPVSVSLQMLWYGLGLVLFFVWTVTAAEKTGRVALGWGALLLLALASACSILWTIPK